MKIVYMMIGVQGSGKTTYAREMNKQKNIPIISSDSLRNERPDLEEKDIFPELYRRCASILNDGGDLIFDATNITPGARTHFIDMLKENGVDMSEVFMIGLYFIPNKELSIERVKIRNKIEGERCLPLEVIDEYVKRIVEPTLDEGFNKIIKIKSLETGFEVVNNE